MSFSTVIKDILAWIFVFIFLAFIFYCIWRLLNLLDLVLSHVIRKCCYPVKNTGETCELTQVVVSQKTGAILRFLQNEQKNAAETETDEQKLERIRVVQNILLEQMLRVGQIKTEGTLIIAVDATPSTSIGYFVNLRESSLDYYVIQREDFPFKLESDEFEMKNLLFALAVWYEQIVKYKNFCVYVDNNGVKSHDKAGEDAQVLMYHLIQCKGANLVNAEYVYINRIDNLEDFAKYIQPANDLFRWDENTGVTFLCDFYGIKAQRVTGTLTPTTYQAKLNAAREFSRNFHCLRCQVKLFEFGCPKAVLHSSGFQASLNSENELPQSADMETGIEDLEEHLLKVDATKKIYK